MSNLAFYSNYCLYGSHMMFSYYCINTFPSYFLSIRDKQEKILDQYLTTLFLLRSTNLHDFKRSKHTSMLKFKKTKSHISYIINQFIPQSIADKLHRATVLSRICSLAFLRVVIDVEPKQARKTIFSPSDEIEGRYPRRVIRARGIRPLDTAAGSAILFSTGCVHANSGRRIAAGRASEKRETRVRETRRRSERSEPLALARS